MRIVLAVHHFPPRRASGAELRAYRLACWLVQAGHEVQVVCIEGTEDLAQGKGLGCVEEMYDGISVQRLSFDLKSWPDPIYWAFDNPFLYQHFEPLLARTKPDLLHLVSGYLMGIAPLRAAQKLGIPSVVTLTDFWFLCPTIQLLRGDDSLCWGPESAECTRCWLNRWRPFHWLELHAPACLCPVAAWLRKGVAIPGDLRAKMQAFLERQRQLCLALNRVSAIICVTQFLADVHIANGVSSELFHVIPYWQGEDAQLAHCAGSPERQGPIHFAYLGSVSPYKGVKVLLRAFRRLGSGSGARLTIFGPVYPPSFLRELERLSAQNGPIRLAGRYEHDELGSILADVDVVVVPSLWHENAPRTLIEAFQHTKPVIASNVGGIAALVRDGVNGLLFERGNSEALAHQMRRIIDEPSLLASLRANIPELLTGPVEQSQVLQVYHQVLGYGDARS